MPVACSFNYVLVSGFAQLKVDIYHKHVATIDVLVFKIATHIIRTNALFYGISLVFEKVANPTAVSLSNSLTNYNK